MNDQRPNLLWNAVRMLLLLNDSDPEATQPMWPTRLTPWRQRNGRPFIQKQTELIEPPVVLAQKVRWKINFGAVPRPSDIPATESEPLEPFVDAELHPGSSGTTWNMHSV